MANDKFDAKLITFRGLDYGLTVSSIGQSLVDKWTPESSGTEKPLLLFLIEAQKNQTAIIADPILENQLPISLLRSTGRTTMNQPIREGQRYRQGSLNAIQRLQIVIDGGADPGPPAKVIIDTSTNIPTKDEVSNSNAIIWVVLLLIIGTAVPMATWWWFSR